MKKILYFAALGLLPLTAQTIEFEVQLENDEVRVSKWKLQPGEEVGLHRDEYPAVVFALQGGTITRFEPDGSTRDVIFPTGVAVYREVDPIDQFHRSINSSETAIEAVMIEIKK
jgi:hypothetical protein